MAKRRGKRMDKLRKIDRKEEKEFNRRNSIECSSDSDSESISSVEWSEDEVSDVGSSGDGLDPLSSEESGSEIF